MELNIAVCIKPVPDSEHYDKITIDPVTKRVNREGIPNTINLMDKHALEAAIRLKEAYGGKVTVFTMAPMDAVEVMRKALAMGADEAVIASDKALGGADTWSTSYTLYKALEKKGDFDLIVMGNQTEDGGTAQVPSQLGEWLNIPHIVNVNDIELQDKTMLVTQKNENGGIKYKVKLPMVVGVLRDINEPRIPNVMGIMRSKNKPLTVFSAEELGVDYKKIGLVGSPTQPGDISSPDLNRKSTLLEGEAEEIADHILNEIKKNGVVIEGGQS